MPNRILRDWTSSETMDSLSLGAEVFFARLIMKADDLGCFYGNPKLLKGNLFALKDYSEKQVKEWRDECHKAGILTCYTIQGKEYVQIINFGQRLRQMKGKFPTAPEIDELAMRSDDGQVTAECPPELETKRSRNEVETNTKDVAEATVSVWPTFSDWWDLYDKKIDRPKCEKKWQKLTQGAREKIMAHTGEYVRATPDIQYRRHPATYLNNESWNNEIVQSNGKSINADKRKDNLLSIAEGIQRRFNAANGTGQTS